MTKMATATSGDKNSDNPLAVTKQQNVAKVVAITAQHLSKCNNK